MPSLPHLSVRGAGCAAGRAAARAGRRRAALLPALVLAATLPALLAGCGQLGAAPQATLSVTPRSGPPGTLLTVTGLTFQASDASALTVTVGGETAPFVVQDDGSLAVAVPLFLGSDGWPAPPADPQTVEVRRSGKVAGTSRDGVTVTALQRAPGTTWAMQTALGQVASDYDRLWAAVPASLPQELPLRHAVAAALQGLADGGEDSLQAVLNGSSPLLSGAAADPALADAILAASGASDALAAYAAALQGAATQAAGAAAAVRSASTAGAVTPQAGSLLCNASGDDFDLACEMQISVVLDDYTQQVVKPTVAAYGKTVGLAAGLLGIAGKEAPAASIIGAILSVGDFVMEKIAPALFPSHLTQFDLEMLKTTIDVGEVTSSDILVAAANNPPSITLSDVIQQALTITGLKSSSLTDEFEKMVEAAAKFDIGLYMGLISDYEGAHPGTFPWASSTVARMPALTWGPVQVTNGRLIKLFSSDEDAVQSLPDQLEWKGASLGEADVRVMPRGPGSRSKVLRDNALCFGCVYYGGAFGNDMPDSTTKVTVGSVVLTATPSQGAAPLSVTFGWTGLTPRTDPYTCTLDFGDGTAPATISDCAHSTSETHSYATTSALASAAGSYTATLSINGTSKRVSTHVTVDWSFTATPGQGQPPFDAAFAWSGLDPADAPFTCVFDPGDGSAPQTLSSCGVAGTLTHRYTTTGSFSAALSVTAAAGTTLRRAQVTSQVTPTCVDAGAIAGWQGSLSFSYDGSADTAAEKVSVHRTAALTLDIDTVASASTPDQPSWTGTVAGGTANEHDVIDYYDTGTGAFLYSDDYAGSTLLTGPNRDATLEVVRLNGVCTYELWADAWTDVTQTQDGVVTLIGAAMMGSVALYEPVLSAGELQGQALLPIYYAQSDEGYLDLDAGGQLPTGANFDLQVLLGGPDAMGTASVSWDLTPIQAGP